MNQSAWNALRINPHRFKADFDELSQIGATAGGASHSAQELTAWEDCVNGANVLLQAALRLADPSGPEA